MAISVAAKPGTPVPPWVVALLAPGAAAVAAETRVRGLDAGAGVGDWPAGGESRDRRWGNAARYDAEASGSTQFLTRDPLTPLTREAYAYVGDNPLNGTDPTGMFCLGPQAICDFFGGNAGRVGGAIASGASSVVSFVGNAIATPVYAPGPNDLSALEQQAQSQKTGWALPWLNSLGLSDSPDPSTLRKLSPGDIRRLKGCGHDPEEIKEDIVGKGLSGKSDLFKSPDGEIYVLPKNGIGEPQSTGLRFGSAGVEPVPNADPFEEADPFEF